MPSLDYGQLTPHPRRQPRPRAARDATVKCGVDKMHHIHILVYYRYDVGWPPRLNVRLPCMDQEGQSHSLVLLHLLGKLIADEASR